MVALGSLGVAPDPGGTAFAWTPYAGNGGCFTWYKLVASTTNPDPSYTTGDGYIWYGTAQGDSSTVVADLASGTTYYFRIQVIKSTALGLFVAAQTGRHDLHHPLAPPERSPETLDPAARHAQHAPREPTSVSSLGASPFSSSSLPLSPPRPIPTSGST